MIFASYTLRLTSYFSAKRLSWLLAELLLKLQAKLFALPIILALLGLIFLTSITSPALADFRLCNTTKLRASVAIAYMGDDDWISEGWWTVNPSACETILRGPLNAEFYYVYAIDERGGEWTGNVFMCSSEHEFKITGREDCFAKGYDRTGFFEVDTGKDAKNWTVQLSEQAR